MLYGRAAGPWKAFAPASDRRRPGLEHSLLPPPSLPMPLPCCAAYATTSELAAAQAAGLTPTVYAMKNPTPAITCVCEVQGCCCRAGEVESLLLQL